MVSGAHDHALQSAGGCSEPRPCPRKPQANSAAATLAAAALWLWLAGRAAMAGVLLPRLPPSRCYSVATRDSPLQWSPVVHRRPYAHH